MRGDRALARAPITNNSIKYTLLTIYSHMKLTRGWVATICTSIKIQRYLSEVLCNAAGTDRKSCEQHFISHFQWRFLRFWAVCSSFLISLSSFFGCANLPKGGCILRRPMAMGIFIGIIHFIIPVCMTTSCEKLSLMSLYPAQCQTK